MNNPVRILAMGWYGAGNVGDELLLQTLIQWCEEAGARVSALSAFPQHTRDLHGIDAIDSFNLRAVAERMSETDLFVLGGGGLFQTHYAFTIPGLYDYERGDISAYARPVLMARQMGVPTLLWAQGVGPLDGREAREIVRDVFSKASHFSVRDESSGRLLKEIGVEREVWMAPDPAWAFPVRWRGAAPSDGKQRLGLVLREWDFAAGWEDAFVEAVRHAVQPEMHRLVWIPFQAGDAGEQASDKRLVDALTSRLGEYEHEVVLPRTPADAEDALGDCDRIACMRLHAQVLALKLGKPALCIEYDPKMAHASEMAGVRASARLMPSAQMDAWRRALVALVDADMPAVPLQAVQELEREALSHKRWLHSAIESAQDRDRTPARWNGDGFDWMRAWETSAMHRLFARRESGLVAQAARSEGKMAVLQGVLQEKEQAAAAASKSAAQHEQELVSLRSAMEAARSELSTERGRVMDMGLRIDELQKQLESYDQAKRTIADQELELESLRSEMEAKAVMDARLESMQGELNGRDDAIRALREEIGSERTAACASAEEASWLRVVNAELSHEGGRLAARLSEQTAEFDKVTTSLSWKITHPLRLTRALITLPAPERKQLFFSMLRSVFWSLPEPLRIRMAPIRSRLSARARQADVVQNLPSTEFDWIALANSSAKIAIVPCAFEFDDLVNQRPINLAKYLARKGYVVIFAAWQWSRGERLAKSNGEVYPGVWQIDLYSLIDHAAKLDCRTDRDSMFFLTLPAPELVSLHQAMRKAGMAVIYDILDEWEAFHGVGQAPWYSLAHECEAVLVSDVVAAVSPPLVAKFGHLRSDLQVIGNGYMPSTLGIDHKFVAARSSEKGAVPRFGYFGHLTDAWFDWSTVLGAARILTDCQFEIIGYGEPDWVREAAEKLPNLTLVGKIPPSGLWAYARHWHAGLAPFRPGPLALAIDPIKVYEYIYLGLPTVCTGIPHLAMLPGVAVVEGIDEFVAACRAKAATEPDYDAMDRCLEDTTWEARFDALLTLATADGFRGAYVS